MAESPAARNAPLGPPPDDFVRFCKGIADLIGVDLSLYKRKQMERRARGLASRFGDGTLDGYLATLNTDEDQLDKFMERMTITVSQLWRNNEIFEAIEKDLLPELDKNAGVRRLQLWSAGCSYGAEPYTLAAVCLEMRDKLSRLPAIKGSDINPHMIDRAKKGFYTDEDARDAPQHLMERYFDRVEGGWSAKTELRTLIRFKVEDLFATNTDSVDLILFRNVAIHFERERRDRVHRILADALLPGGMLVLGSTEMIVHPAELGLERVRPFVFRKLPVEVVESGSEFP